MSTTFAVGSSYPPIDMRRVSTWSRVDDFFEPCAWALQRTGVDLGHVTEQRRLAGARRRRNYDGSALSSAATTTLYGVARFGQGILGSHRRARTLGRRAASAGSVGVENELFVDITVLQ